MAVDPLPKGSPSKPNGPTADPPNTCSPRQATTAKTPAKLAPAMVKPALSNERTSTKAKSPTRTPRTPRTAPAVETDDNATPERSSKRVAASLAAVRTAKKPRTSLPSFDVEVFGSPSGSTPKAKQDAISTEEFRANERLRRQREARNFKFEGDANAPRTTRSGRIVAPPSTPHTYGRDGDEEESKDGADEYGIVQEEELEAEEEKEVAGVRLEVPLIAESRRSSSPSVAPLPVNARSHVLRILASLTGSEREPAPFDNEEDNEALQGLVSLLRGTVERGEGNSALVTGPRGVGKTRVSQRCGVGDAGREKSSLLEKTRKDWPSLEMVPGSYSTPPPASDKQGAPTFARYLRGGRCERLCLGGGGDESARHSRMSELIL